MSSIVETTSKNPFIFCWAWMFLIRVELSIAPYIRDGHEQKPTTYGSESILKVREYQIFRKNILKFHKITKILFCVIVDWCVSVDWSTSHVPFSLFSHTYRDHRVFYKLIQHASKIGFIETTNYRSYCIKVLWFYDGLACCSSGLT